MGISTRERENADDVFMIIVNTCTHPKDTVAGGGGG